MNRSLVISKFTLLEILKGKIYYILFILGFIILLLSYVASTFSYGDPKKVALDIGLGLMTVLNVVLAVSIGSNLISKEMENRTIYLLVSRNVQRSEILLGKILGLLLAIGINTLVLSVFTLGAFVLSGGSINAMIFGAVAFMLLEAIWVLLLVVLFSMISNTMLSVLFTVVTYLLGHWVFSIVDTRFVSESLIISSIVKISSYVLPNFQMINLKPFVVYQKDLDWGSMIGPLVYWLCYSLMLILLSIKLFKRKELN